MITFEIGLGMGVGLGRGYRSSQPANITDNATITDKNNKNGKLNFMKLSPKSWRTSIV
ncbi:MAG: hypothetical protein H7230_01385 [Candidatus Parcubacteria bacterium]|nr:hypothetical protein [Candidatus Paceibacterota bacterium]